MIFNRGNFGLFARYRRDPDRPMVKPAMGPVDWLIEAVAVSGLMVFIGFTLYHFPHLPDTLPTHFNGSGQADEFGGKSTFLILPGIACFVYILLTLINMVPHTFNFTVKITPANARWQYTMATRLIRVLKTSVIWGFWYISFSTLQVAKGAATGMGVWFVPVFLGIIFIPIIIFVIQASRSK